MTIDERKVLNEERNAINAKLKKLGEKRTPEEENAWKRDLEEFDGVWHKKREEELYGLCHRLEEIEQIFLKTGELDPDILSRIESLEIQIGPLRSAVETRCEEVLNRIFKIGCFVDGRQGWYDFENRDDYSENPSSGDFDISAYSENVQYLLYDFEKIKDVCAILNGEEYWIYSENEGIFQFPTRFLWEDFEKELKDGIKEYERKEK